MSKENIDPLMKSPINGSMCNHLKINSTTVSIYNAHSRGTSISRSIERKPPPVPSPIKKPPPHSPRVLRPSNAPIFESLSHIPQFPSTPQQEELSTASILSRSHTNTSASIPPFGIIENRHVPPSTTIPRDTFSTINYTHFSFCSEFKNRTAAVLFWIHIGGYMVISFFAFKSIFSPVGNSAGLSNQLFGLNSLQMYGIICLIGTFLSIVCIMLLARFPPIFTTFIYGLSILIFLSSTIFFGIVKVYVLVVISALLVIFYIGKFLLWRQRVRFTSELIHSITHVAAKYPMIWMLTTLGMLFQVTFSAWWFLVLLGSYQFFEGLPCSSSYDDSTGARITSCTNIVLTLILMYSIFTFYWASQVVRYVIHVTIAGIFSSYYLSFNNAESRYQSIRSLVRACTTSFGSICYGSLILPTIRLWISVLSSITCFPRLNDFFTASTRYVNVYGFTHMAIYGKPYCLAAQVLKKPSLQSVFGTDFNQKNTLFIGLLESHEQ